MDLSNIFVALFVIGVFYIFGKKRIPDGFQKVPKVKGSVPIAGHGFKFKKDIMGYIRKCYREYGKIFEINIFGKKMVVVCDRNLIEEYFKLQEPQMSLYYILDKLYFSNAFSDDPGDFTTIIKIVKNTVGVRYEEFVPKIKKQADEMVKLLSKKNGQFVLSHEMMRFVAYTSAACFTCTDLEPIFETLEHFTHLLNQIVVMTNFLPKWLLKLIYNPRLRNYRRIMTTHFLPTIQEYIDDPTKSESMIIRKTVDYIDPKTNRKFTPHEIGDVLVCLLYVSSENTALGLSATMTDLIQSPNYLNQIRFRTSRYLKNEDYKGLFKDELLEAVVMESARRNTHIFPLQRKPLSCQKLGNYYVGHADSVALCEPMLMVYEASTDIFSEPFGYNPSRFLNPNNENVDSKSVMTWGSGVHICPGKQFAIYEIKMAVALLTNHFNFVLPEEIPELNYFSPSAFAERSVLVSVTPYTQPDTDNSETESVNSTTDSQMVQIGERMVSIYQTEDNHYGWYIPNYFTVTEQQKLLGELNVPINPSNAPIDKALPYAYYNLVYTGASNLDKPTTFFEIASTIWKLLLPEIQQKYPEMTELVFNSLYSQLFGIESKMSSHKDEHVDFGISISIGASCDFVFGNNLIELHSGDVFIADFSKVMHGVPKIHGNTPEWFDSDNLYDRIRCSIQLRSIKENLENPISQTEFEQMVYQ